jgi:hypothetical protein
LQEEHLNQTYPIVDNTYPFDYNPLMTNWRERAEAELARQSAIQEQSQEALQIINGQQKLAEATESQRIDQLQSEIDGLNIPQKLADINRDVLKGLGKVEVQPWSFLYYSSGPLTRTFLLEHSQFGPENVTAEERTRYEKKFGSYDKVVHASSYMGESGETTTVETKRVFGWHDESVGQELTGGYDVSKRDCGLVIIIHPNPSSNETSVLISDHFGFAGNPNIPTNNGWEIRSFTRNAGRYDPAGIYGKPFDYSEISTIIGLRDGIYDSRNGEARLVSRIGRSSSGLVVSFPHSKDNIRLVIDALLLQSCAARLPHVDEWLRERQLADIKIKDIQSREGQQV